MKLMKNQIVTIFFLLLALTPITAQAKLKVGVTLHPYYSWVANIAADTVELSTVIPESADPHSYQARPQDLENLAQLDAVVVNTLGHDDYIEAMLTAAGRADIKRIEPNSGLPLIAASHKRSALGGGDNTTSYNSHTYVSILGAIRQIDTIARELSKLQPEHKGLYRKNNRTYARRLRNLLGRALKRLKEQPAGISIATVHDGYAYMLQELGVTVDAVIQPRHGIEPSARQLADTIKRIRKAKVNVLFSEVDYKKKYVDTIFEETGCRVHTLSHISNGPYTPEKFEQDMAANLETLVQALTALPQIKE